MAWTNPTNGRTALYIASHAYTIEGMEQAAAQRLLAELIDAATAPGFSYVHAWRKGDVVMWDNRATLHRGRPWRRNRGSWYAPRFPQRMPTGSTASARPRVRRLNRA
jgi:alpha-ketoglutarate-dependent taurine dioxygenase